MKLFMTPGSGNKELISACSFDYMACIYMYDGRWWIGVVLEKNDEQLDLLIRFMHPSGLLGHFIILIKKIYVGFWKQRLYVHLLHHVQFLVDNTQLASVKLTKLK